MAQRSYRGIPTPFALLESATRPALIERASRRPLGWGLVDAHEERGSGGYLVECSMKQVVMIRRTWEGLSG